MIDIKYTKEQTGALLKEAPVLGSSGGVGGGIRMHNHYK